MMVGGLVAALVLSVCLPTLYVWVASRKRQTTRHWRRIFWRAPDLRRIRTRKKYRLAL